MFRGEGRGLSGGRASLAVCACLIACLTATIAAGTAHAYVPTGSDFRISNVFTDGDASRVGTDSAVAYNSAQNEYLVVFRADPTTNDEFEIYGRRVNAAGAPLGSDFRISAVGDDGDADRDAEAPDVAYNAAAGQYLVVWSGDDLPADEEHEIFAQRVTAAGAPVSLTDIRISNVDPGGAERDAELPAVTADPEANRYLVSWQADDDELDDKLEIYARLVSGAGTPDAAGDFRISNGAPDSEQTFDAVASDAVYNSAANEYLVVWQGEAFEATPGLAEIWAQRVSAAGVPNDGQGDLRVSDVGADNAARDGLAPAVAYNPANNAYLVVWRDDGFTGAADNEFEIFGQRMSAIGDEQADDFRISTVGTDGDASRAADAPDAAFSTAAGEYLVAWHSDGLATEDEHEIFGQRLTANGGGLDGDQRISSAGSDGVPSIDALDPSVAFGSASNRFLTTWSADDLGTNDEFEIFGRLLAPAPTTGAPPPPPPERAYELPKKCKKKKKKKKKGKSLAAAAKKKKKKKKKKC
jgi:hypothetical protein